MIAVTVDVDGPWGLNCRPGEWAGRLTSESEAAFGLGRGLDRVLGVLAALGARATFFVVGSVALRAPERVREIAAAGHEVAHHGFAHLPTLALDARQERDELERGLDALGGCLGSAPAGYRSPAWELTPVTLGLLGELGFAYDSSLMGDDRPYRLGGLVELPVHWTLDDVPYLAFQPERPSRLGGLAAAIEVWGLALADAVAERRPLVYTLHSEHTGRSPHHRLLEALLERTDGATCTALELASSVPATGRMPPGAASAGAGRGEHERAPRDRQP